MGLPEPHSYGQGTSGDDFMRPFYWAEEVEDMAAELAALKGRRCETCDYAGDISAVGFAARCCKKCWGWVPITAGCDDWAARAEEGGE